MSVPTRAVVAAEAVVASEASAVEALPAEALPAEALLAEALLAVVTASLVAVPVVDVAALAPSTPTTPVLSPAWAASNHRNTPTQRSAAQHKTRPDYRLTEFYVIVILGIKIDGHIERHGRDHGIWLGRGDCSGFHPSAWSQRHCGRSCPHLKSKKCISPSLIHAKLVQCLFDMFLLKSPLFLP